MKKYSFVNPVFTDNESSYVLPILLDDNSSTVTYSWSNVNVFAKPTSLALGSHKFTEEKQILKKVSGICRPGELIAIMGASGSGKTSLLNVLTSRSGNNLRVEGDLFLNGKKMSVNELTKKSGYVQQEDLFIGDLTVKEQLIFQATLRMDKGIPKKRRLERVEEVIEELGLKKCENTLIGDPGKVKGISGGEMKRLAFACEVLTDPFLMFCDEPTSGLDSFMAQNIVSVMRDFATKKKTVISTIHQPSSEVFAMFDRVLLLAEGRLAYLGLTSDALNFFSRLGKTCPLDYNPADFFISNLAIRPEEEKESHEEVDRICDVFEASEDYSRVIAAVKANEGHKTVLSRKNEKICDFDFMKESPYKMGRRIQFLALLKRTFLETVRNPILLRIKILQVVMLSVIISLIYLDTSGHYNQTSIQNVNGCLFILVSNLSFTFSFGVVNTFCSQIPIFLRENMNGMYRTDMYYITKSIADIPGSIIFPLLFLLFTFYFVNINRELSCLLIIAAALILVANASLSFGYLISTLAKNINIGLAIAAPMLIPLMVFGGFFLNSESVPVYFVWLKYISWFNYGNEAVIVAQWRNVQSIECDLEPPCMYKNGTQVIEFLGYSEDNLWIDFGSLFGLTLLFRVLAFLGLLYRTYSKS